MWEQQLPAIQDELRQGDLLNALQFPRVESVRIDKEALTGSLYRKPSSSVVLEHCCTIDQQHVLTIARVISHNFEKDDLYLKRLELRVAPPDADGLYAPYEFLLGAHSAMPTGPKGYKVIDLRERVTMRSNSGATWEHLRVARVGRMDVLARAHLRAKLIVYWGRPEAEDRDSLHALGFDWLGRPLQGP